VQCTEEAVVPEGDICVDKSTNLFTNDMAMYIINGCISRWCFCSMS